MGNASTNKNRGGSAKNPAKMDEAALLNSLQRMPIPTIMKVQAELAKQLTEIQKTALHNVFIKFPQLQVHKPKDQSNLLMKLTFTDNDWEKLGKIVGMLGKELEPGGFSFNIHCIRPSAETQGMILRAIITPLPVAMYFLTTDLQEEELISGHDLADLFSVQQQEAAKK